MFFIIMTRVTALICTFILNGIWLKKKRKNPVKKVKKRTKTGQMSKNE